MSLRAFFQSSLLIAGLLALTAGSAPAEESTRSATEARKSQSGSSPERQAEKWLAEYLRIDTTNPPGNEAQAVAFLASKFHRLGLETRRLIGPTGRTALYARVETGPPDAPAIVLLHHMDVVPAGEGWTLPPFSGEVHQGRLWGRGAVDSKGLGIAQLSALAEIVENRTPLCYDLIYLAVPDEERGGLEGTAWILDHHEKLLGDVSGVLNEGGGNMVTAEKTLWAGIEVVQKRPLWLRLSARGRGGHASALRPSSAVHQLTRALGRLLEKPVEYRSSQAAKTYFEALAPLENDRYRQIFGNIDDFLELDGPTVPVPAWAHSLLADSLQITVLEGSSSINSIASEASAEIDLRLLPDTDESALLAEVRDLVGPDVEVEVLLSAPPSEPSSLGTDLYRASAEVLGREAPVVPLFIPGITDSRYFRQRGIPAYGISPFFLEPADLLGIHGVDERLPLKELDRGVQRLRSILEAAGSCGERP